MNDHCKIEFKEKRILENRTNAENVLGVEGPVPSMVARYGLAADTPARVLQGEWLHLEYVDLNEAWKKFRDTREAFFWTLKRYRAERGREVPEQVKALFDTYVDWLASVFHEADLRVSFQEVVDLVDQSMTDDEQLEFYF